MPGTQNINPPIPGLSVNVRSIQYWLWPSVVDTSAEVAAAVSHYCTFDAYAQNNLNGAKITSGWVDTGAQTIQERYGSLSLQTVLEQAFD